MGGILPSVIEFCPQTQHTINLTSHHGIADTISGLPLPIREPAQDHHRRIRQRAFHAAEGRDDGTRRTLPYDRRPGRSGREQRGQRSADAWHPNHRRLPAVGDICRLHDTARRRDRPYVPLRPCGRRRRSGERGDVPRSILAYMAAADQARAAHSAGIPDILLHPGRDGQGALLYVRRKYRRDAAYGGSRHLLHVQYADAAPPGADGCSCERLRHHRRMGGDIRRDAPVIRAALRIQPAGEGGPLFPLRELARRPRRRDDVRIRDRDDEQRLRRGRIPGAPGADPRRAVDTPSPAHRPADARRGPLDAGPVLVDARIRHGGRHGAPHRHHGGGYRR